MSASQPKTMPVPVRSRWRAALIRLLGGGAPAPATSPLPVPSPDSLPLPKLTPGQLRSQAHHFFRYGEELAHRGAPDLAAPFYRQAFTLLEADLGVPVSASPSSPRSPANSLSSPEPSGDRRVLPSSGEPERPAQDLAATFGRLRQALNRDNAGAILDKLAILERQGVQHVELHRLAGLSHLLLNDLGNAETDFRKALAIDPHNYAALVNLSGVLLAGGDANGAEGLLNRALERVDPDTPEAVPALSNLSLAHEQAGRPMDAAHLMLRVHRLQPGHIREARLLQAATTLEEMGEDVAAIELLTWLRQQHPRTEVLERLAPLLERRGEYREAALVYRDLLGAVDSGASASE